MFIEKDTTILIEGRARISVKGCAEIFGCPIKDVEVKEGKILPVYVNEDSEIDIDGNYIAVKGKTIPKNWDELVEEIRSNEYRKILFLGETDSGKSSLAAYLVNRLDGRKWVVDLDIGQSDIAHPCAMGFGFTDHKIISISQIDMFDGFFIGTITPTGNEARCLRGVTVIMKKLERLLKNGDRVLIDTTGWVRGKRAKNYKLAKIEIINPDVIVCFNQIPHYLDSFNTFKVDSFVLKKRSRELRSSIRSKIYAEWLENSDVRCFKVDEINLGNTTLFKGEKIDFLEGVLDAEVVYAEKGDDFLNVCVEKEVKVGLELIRALLSIYKVKEVCIFSIDQIKRLLVGLYGERYLGCGLLEDVNLEDREISILTPVRDAVKRIEFGEIRLDENYREVHIRVP